MNMVSVNLEMDAAITSASTLILQGQIHAARPETRTEGRHMFNVAAAILEALGCSDAARDIRAGLYDIHDLKIRFATET